MAAKAGAGFWMRIGICFPDQGALGSKNPPDRVPKYEPFFFIYLADDQRKKTKASTLFSKIPEGWVEINDYDLVIARAVGEFEADPDRRVQSVIEWAQEEVGRALACIPNFEGGAS